MSVNVPAGLVVELENVLKDRGVTHDGLVGVGKNSNYAFSDNVGVFVKVSGLKDRRGLDSEVSFIKSYGEHISTSRLLVDEVIPVMGGERFAAFYRFECLEALSYNMLVPVF